jgi:hypothetical protein
VKNPIKDSDWHESPKRYDDVCTIVQIKNKNDTRRYGKQPEAPFLPSKNCNIGYQVKGAINDASRPKFSRKPYDFNGIYK